MAMSHENCSHPRTPAGRAACRKAGGPAGVVEPRPNAKSAKITIVPAKGQANIKNGATKRPRTKAVGDPAKVDATRVLRANVDTKDIPHVFKPAISQAWKLGYEVHTGTPYHAAQRVVTIKSDAGTMTLTWLATNPHGVSQVAFRPADSSLTSHTTINEAMRKLEGN